MNCSDVAKVLLLDDDTDRTWYRPYEEYGFEGLASFGYDGSACRLNDQQQDRLKAWITETLPRTTSSVGAWIEKKYSIICESRSGLVALLHRLGIEHRKPSWVRLSPRGPPNDGLRLSSCAAYVSRECSMDKATIFTDLTRRNALRMANGLPLLDLRTEYAHQIWIGRREEYWAACDEHADEREAIHRQVLAEFRAKYGPNFPSTSGGHWAVGLKTSKRFAAYMELRYGVFPPRPPHAP